MKKADVGIIGGGLAGLAAAIEMAKAGLKVVLWEKKSYPFHRVCGEYISMESWSYLKHLGLPLDLMDLPIIKRLKVSVPSGNELEHRLELGGFGISRFSIDHELAKIALDEGVDLVENCLVREASYQDGCHRVETALGNYKVELLVGAQGKRSNMDKAWKRKFIQKPLKDHQNFTAVKYHLEADLPDDLIGLHLFEGGYCGISKVEGENTYCMCYLTLASSIKKAGGIKELEEQVLSKNPYLKKYMAFPRLFEKAEVIAQVNFSSKSKIEEHAFMLGDTAGLIVPLCGNGMSMAFHAAYFWSDLAKAYFKKEINRKEFELAYQNEWKKAFSKRLQMSKMLQKLFYKLSWTEGAIKLLSRSEKLSSFLIKQTHGKPFYHGLK
jgi:flavin-dependent dehydrogenase